MTRYLTLFCGLLALLFGLELLQPVQQQLVLPFTSVLAQVSTWLVRPFDASILAMGKVIMNSHTGLAVSVEPGCNGVEACMVLTAAIWAFPAPWRYRLVGWLAGLLAVQVLNIVRIISLFYLLQWNMAWFKFSHEYLWQGLIMLDVLLVFMLWTHQLAKRRSNRVGVPSSPITTPAAP